MKYKDKDKRDKVKEIPKTVGEMTFRTLGGEKPVELVAHLKEKIGDRKDVSIYLGTDSQNVASRTIYALVVVLHYGNNGAHVVYAKNKFDRIADGFTRLWKEVEMTIELAEFLKEAGIQKPKFIDLDFNPDPYFRSNQVLRAALGYVESMGYTPRCKPDAVSASYVADKICNK